MNCYLYMCGFSCRQCLAAKWWNDVDQIMGGETDGIFGGFFFWEFLG